MKIREALQNLVHLHMCEQEGIESGQPTSEQWFKAVEDAEEALRKEQEQGDMTEDEFDNKTECLFNKPTTEQPSIELSKLSKLDLKQMLLEIFEHRMGDFTIDHYVTLIFYSLTNTK